jgi:peptidoglycan-associated lipoprotein
MLFGLGGVLLLPAMASAEEEAGQAKMAPIVVEKDAGKLTTMTKAGETTSVRVQPGSTTATKVDANGNVTSETLETKPGAPTKIVTTLVAPAPALPKLVPVYFETDSAEIQSISMPLLDATAAALKANPQVKVVEVQGHADARGPDAYNDDLTERRALAVSAALEERGVASSRIQSTGLGTAEPVCSEDDEDCWSQNRRVDILPLAAASGGSNPSGG